MTKYPTIKIAYNRFLDPIFIAYIKAQPQWKDWETPSMDIVLAQVDMYQGAWNTYGRKILKGLCNTTGLQFRRNQIDVHVVSGNPRPFSRPIVLKSRYSEHDFINTLTHELIHCLFADNGFNGEYPHEDEIVRFHVLVYAIIEHIFKDCLKMPELLKRDEAPTVSSFVGYLQAQDIVAKEGYQKILAKFFPTGRSIESVGE